MTANARRKLVLTFTFALAMVGLPASSALAQQFSAVAPNQVLVKFHPAAPDAAQSAARNEDIAETRTAGGSGALLMRSRSKDTWTLIRRLKARADVVYAEPDYLLQAIKTPNDTFYSYLWAMPKIGAPAAWDKTTGSASVAVGVVDTGVAYTHPDLAATVWSAPNSFSVTIGGTTVTCAAGTHGLRSIGGVMTCDPADDNDHGSHVSGTIGAAGNNATGVAGVNWTSSIVGLKFLNSAGSGYTSDAINAIEFAIQLKQQGLANIRVLSNSYGGGGGSQAFSDEINKAYQNDILFVAAAGNSGSNNDTSPFYPASYTVPNVVAVAATDSNDALPTWSNYGPTSVALAAPGVNIYSALHGGNYGYMSGTSMATPHVSGAAALLLSACGLSTDSLKAAILGNVDPVGSLAGKVAAGGRLNVSRALNSCSPGTPDFTMSASPSSAAANTGGSAKYTVTVSALNGFNSDVTLSVTGAPSTATFDVNPVHGGSGTSTLSAAAGTRPGTYTLTITGTSGSLVHSTTVMLVVSGPAPDFTLSASPASQSVKRGGSTTYTVTIARLNGFNSSVQLSVTELPTQATGTFSPNPANGTSTLTVTTTTSSRVRTYTLRIRGIGGGLTRTKTVTLVVTT